MKQHHNVYLDIETYGGQQEPTFHDISAPSNYKDPDKIAAWINDKLAEQVSRAALNIDLGVISAIGMRMGEAGRTISRLVTDQYTERHLLRSFWRCMEKCHGETVGYNTLGFDLPFIMRRSWELEVRVPIFPDMRRYNNFPTTDLMQILAGWDREKVKGLKFICARYGIPNALPDLDGSMYANMDEEIRLAYVKNDVNLVVNLYKRMKGYYL